MPVERAIRRLHLRARSDSEARRMVPRFEDALRTASLPDSGGRLILIRRLALGRIRADLSSLALAQALEAAIERAGCECVHGTEAAAANAQAVWFADAVEAHTALALRCLRGPAPREWFWRLLWPACTEPATPTAALRAILQRLGQGETAAAAIPAWTAALTRAGHAQAWLDAVECDDVATLRALTDTSATNARAARLTPLPATRAIPPRSSAHGLLVVAPGKEAVVQCLVDLIVHAGARELGEQVLRSLIWDVSQTGHTGRNVDVLSSPSWSEPDTPQTPAVDRQHTRIDATSAESADAGIAPSVPTTRHRHGNAAAPLSPTGPDALAALDAESSSDSTQPAILTSHTPWPQGEPTQAGGLAFLLPVLMRLQFPQWLDSQPDWALQAMAQRVFARVLDRLGITADDPARQLAALPIDLPQPPECFIAPPVWRGGVLSGGAALRRRDRIGGGEITDASGRLLLAVWSGALRPNYEAWSEWEDVDTWPSSPTAACPTYEPLPRDTMSLPDRVEHAWLTAARRWLRRYAGIGIADLVRRPALLWSTATHLDLRFDLSIADLRLRRTGLDFDPGWLPWFGRVVRFEYSRL